jgi:hypothetical protein
VQALALPFNPAMQLIVKTPLQEVSAYALHQWV